MQMSINWIMSEAKKTHGRQDVAILENPQAIKYLDDLLLEKFWPDINICLEQSGYKYSPEPDIESELSYELQRTLTFMLFDDEIYEPPRAIFRGSVKVSKKEWMFNREFYLPLPRSNNQQAVIEILANSRLAGNPPTLTINNRSKTDFYQIDFNNGTGASWGYYDNKYIIEKIKKIISINVQLYNFSKGGISQQQVGEFLTVAYEAYEAF